MHVAEIRLFQLKFEKYINFINKEGQFFTTRKTEGPQLSRFCWVCVLLRFYLSFYLYLSTHLLRTSWKYQNRDKYSKKNISPSYIYARTIILDSRNIHNVQAKWTKNWKKSSWNRLANVTKMMTKETNILRILKGKSTIKLNSNAYKNYQLDIWVVGTSN